MPMLKLGDHLGSQGKPDVNCPVPVETQKWSLGDGLAAVWLRDTIVHRIALSNGGMLLFLPSTLLSSE